MKALVRSVIWSGAAVLVLGLVLGALLLAPVPTHEEGAVFTNLEPVEISSVAVENATGSYRYYYEGDGYVLDDIPGTLVDLDAFIGFMTCGRLSPPASRTRRSATAWTPPPPPWSWSFSAAALRLTVGAESGGYYVAVEGFPGVPDGRGHGGPFAAQNQ